MEILSQVSNTQFLFTAAAVAVVLVCAALVFAFGFRSAEQPQFDRLPLVIDDKKTANKKYKKKDKKSSPNRTIPDDVKAKSDNSKKSPAKEKKEEKVKEAEKPKIKVKSVESKDVKKDVQEKKGKKNKSSDLEKPADFDDGLWQEVPKKSEKKKVKAPEEKEKDKKKESPAKKNKKAKDADVEAARPVEDSLVEDKIKVISAEGPDVDEDAARALQAQVEELQRVLKEAERRDQVALGVADDDDPQEVEELTDVKDLRSNKKKENKEKQNKKKANESTAANKSATNPEPLEKDNSDSDKQNDKPVGPAFDELGDTWTDAKVNKKGKKKARKDQ